ncbi:MAG: hypothetical protein ACOVOZ_05245 [Burkholderiaceae bacterium]
MSVHASPPAVQRGQGRDFPEVMGTVLTTAVGVVYFREPATALKPGVGRQALCLRFAQRFA